MGYESKAVVVERSEHVFQNGNKSAYGDELARFDLSKMGYEKVDGVTFRDLFNVPVDFDLYNMSENVDFETKKDCYGDICEWTTIDNVVSWLEKSKTGKEYRRAKLFLDFLKSLKSHESEYRQICVTHFGY